ncbi:serine hydrolase domain-containing protein [Aquabacterium sp. OR-4]|uniref:serine hydrolase domain-containing protein n=1 Tax=Aquabacterium sp. OR-4 TaxID=2978127 RepID=UPI0028C81C7F|nr:serine hydrolase [Aquabacterium sp. OR-4]MDT7835979.1 serine hydrolase [Aquabacterium sp. OR-4]
MPSMPALLGLLALLSLAGCAGSGPYQALQVASGLSSQLVCIDTLQSGLPLARSLQQRVLSPGAMHLVGPVLDVQVDVAQRRVRSSLAGLLVSQATLRDGMGCLLQWPGDPAPHTPGLPPLADGQLPDLPSIAGPAVVAPATPALRQALARGFDEGGARPPALNTLAVVVLQHGRVLGEQYAPGVGPATPLLGFSMSKSLTHALAGMLVQQGRLQPDAALPFKAWQTPGDARASITLAQLMRQTSGLALRQDNSGTDPNSRMLFIEHDKAGWALQQPLHKPPGQAWAYTDGHFVLAGRLLRDAAGDSPQALRDLAQRALLGPLGMQGTTLTLDATGTPQAASMFVAPARDWARLGQLYLNDGLAGGRRLLPAGWAHRAATPTLDTGYGEGWWTNARGGERMAAWDLPWGLASAPRDAFFARGFMGQYTVVVPSRGVVIVRMGISSLRGDAIEAVNQLVGEVLAALPE